jgi:hypothetical protein
MTGSVREDNAHIFEGCIIFVFRHLSGKQKKILCDLGALCGEEINNH